MGLYKLCANVGLHARAPGPRVEPVVNINIMSMPQKWFKATLQTFQNIINTKYYK